jgi:hypothetical protein
MNERLIHDAAFGAAVFLLEHYPPCACGEERRRAFDLTYRTIRGAIEAYEIQLNRLQARLRPGKN